MPCALEIARVENVINSQKRPQIGVCRAEPSSRFVEAVLFVFHQVMVGVGHWGVVEISANKRWINALSCVCRYFVNLNGSFSKGACHPVVYICNVLRKFFALYQSLYQPGKGDGMGFKMDIVNPYNFPFYINVGVKREVGPLAKEYLIP